MPRLKANEVPKLRLHKPSGRAVVTLSGKDIYCGKWGTPEAEAEYRRATAEWLATGKRRPPAPEGPTVAQLAGEWVAWMERRYRKRGEPTTHVKAARSVAKELVALYGPEPAASFSVRWLTALAGVWKAKGVSAGTCNKYLGIVRRLVRWAVTREMMPADAKVRAEAVPGVSWRDGFPVTPGVRPVPDDVFRETVEAMKGGRFSRPVAVLKFMRLTGARPREACAIRLEDLDRSGDIWIYRVAPEWNKTQHLGRTREVAVGPKAQEIMRPWIARAERWRVKGYIFPGRGPKGYSPQSLAVAVIRTCKRLGVEPWGPNRLRHSFATEVRARFGLDAARAALGHANVRETLIYAERDRELDRRIAEEIG